MASRIVVNWSTASQRCPSATWWHYGLERTHLPPNIPSITPGSTATGFGLGVSVTMNVPALRRLNSVGSYGWSGAATTTFSVDPEERLTYVILAQLMPNDTALMQRVETLIYQAIID